jgi:hypothetical protein
MRKIYPPYAMKHTISWIKTHVTYKPSEIMVLSEKNNKDTTLKAQEAAQDLSKNKIRKYMAGRCLFDP